MKLITSIATLLTFVSVIQAQNSTETYPVDGTKPVPKAEWVEIVKAANITNAPVLKSTGSDGPDVSGTDKYCDWAKSGCTGTSIYDCPKGQWGLTFDDGPSEVSPILYDFLKSTNQKATLFMIGKNVRKFPEIVKRAYDEGHELAIHTWTHSFMTTLSNEQIIAELKWTELAIKEVTGVSPRLFRPPYGDIDNRVRDIGEALGFTSVIWDHDTNDWMLAENAPGFKSEWVDGNFTKWVAEANTSSTGGLSLEHDIQRVTVDAAIRNLPALQKAYKVVTVGQCAGVPSYKESNLIVPVNATTVSSSIIPSATPLAVVPAAPSASPTPSQQAKAAVSENSSNVLVVSSFALSSIFVALFLI